MYLAKHLFSLAFSIASSILDSLLSIPIKLILVLLVWILFNYTKLGLRIKAVGENPEAAESVGISVNKVKYIALTMSGILAALGGTFLSMGYVTLFSLLGIS